MANKRRIKKIFFFFLPWQRGKKKRDPTTQEQFSARVPRWRCLSRCGSVKYAQASPREKERERPYLAEIVDQAGPCKQGVIKKSDSVRDPPSLYIYIYYFLFVFGRYSCRPCQFESCPVVTLARVWFGHFVSSFIRYFASFCICNYYFLRSTFFNGTFSTYYSIFFSIFSVSWRRLKNLSLASVRRSGGDAHSPSTFPILITRHF